jgi:hypothetical protein
LSAIARGCNCANGHAKSIRRWMSRLARSKDTSYAKDWRTRGPALKMSVAPLNLLHA